MTDICLHLRPVADCETCRIADLERRLDEARNLYMEARDRDVEHIAELTRRIVTWLHARADTMNDQHARGILNSAALALGEGALKPPSDSA